MTWSNPNDQICLNPGGPDYRKKNTGHIIKNGFNAKGNQMFECKTCGVRFPETKGTVFYNRHLKEEQIIMICKRLVLAIETLSAPKTQLSVMANLIKNTRTLLPYGA